jgi:hypothetical protein
MAALAGARLARFEPPAAGLVCGIALVFGLLYGLVNPPFAASNELHHLARAYELSGGQVRARESDGNSFSVVPLAWAAAAERYISLPERPSRRLSLAELRAALSEAAEPGQTWQLYNPLSADSPLAYAALVPGLWLARVLSVPPLWAIYLARLSGLACFCALIYLALALRGDLAWPLAALALTPALLTQAGAASPDSLTAALAFVFVALVEHSAPRVAPIVGRRRARALLLAVYVGLVCCNPTCALFGFALPVVAWSDTPRPLARWGYTACAIVAACGAAALLAYIGTGHGPLALPPLAKAQLTWAAGHPLDVLNTLRRSLFRYLDDYMLQFFVVRDVLSTQMRFSAGVIATLEAELIAVLAIGSARGGTAAAPHKARWFALTALAFVGLVIVQALLTSSKVGPGRLQNIYGRLFLPAGPLLLAALAHVGHPIARRWLLARGGVRVLTLSALLNLCWLLLLGARFYGANEPPWRY